MKNKKEPFKRIGAYFAYMTIRVSNFAAVVRCLSLFENNA